MSEADTTGDGRSAARDGGRRAFLKAAAAGGGSLLALGALPSAPAIGTVNASVAHAFSLKGVPGGEVINLVPGEKVFNMVAEVVNPDPTTSEQYGYFTSMKGFDEDDLFRGDTHDETTARFTFFTEADTRTALPEAGVLYLWRTGRTSIYENRAPADFGDRDTFRSGRQIVIAALTNQQAMIEPAAGSFRAINRNKISHSSPFRAGGRRVQWGAVGDAFATYISGTVTTPASGTWTAVGLGAESHLE